MGAATIGIKSDWLASATIRLGMTAFDNRSLFYVKGGGAWIHNMWDLHDTVVFYDPTLAGETRAGWTAGVGWEYMFTQNWTFFVEGNYYDFGNGKAACDRTTFYHARSHRASRRLKPSRSA